MGWGLEALKESASTRRGKAETKELPLLYPPFSFLWERKGFLLTVCLQLRAKQSRASPSFTSRFALVTVGGRPSPKPSLTPLHVISCCAMRSFIRRYRATNFKFTFLGCGSRWVKFANLAKFDFKFERKTIRRSIFLLRYARSF